MSAGVLFIMMLIGIRVSSSAGKFCVKSLVGGKWRATGDCKANIDVASIAADLQARVAPNPSKIKVDPSTCNVVYQNKCFIFHRHSSQNIFIDDARRICEEKSMTMANFYTVNHYILMLTYGWAQIQSGQIFNNYWLGMTYNSNSDKVFLANGSDAQFVKWRPTLPYSNTEPYLMLVIGQEITSSYNGIENTAGGGSTFGVICETAL